MYGDTANSPRGKGTSRCVRSKCHRQKLGFGVPRTAIGVIPLDGHGSLLHGHGHPSWPLFHGCWTSMPNPLMVTRTSWGGRSAAAIDRRELASTTPSVRQLHWQFNERAQSLNTQAAGLQLHQRFSRLLACPRCGWLAHLVAGFLTINDLLLCLWLMCLLDCCLAALLVVDVRSLQMRGEASVPWRQPP